MVTFKVTRADLRHEYDDPSSCPINQAIARKLRLSNKEIVVSPYSVIICGKRYVLPAHANKKASSRAASWKRWLYGGFTFSLDIPA